ncbi:MAG: histidine kinase dimerization/phospho-acceptor domain-containing protein [Candidatus Binatia bacterium]
MSEPERTIDPARRRVAHEVRNSLGAIRTATELLERRYRPDGKEQRLFQVILKEIDRLDEITLLELGPNTK